MGYDSWMNTCYFKSHLGVEEIKERYKQYEHHDDRYEFSEGGDEIFVESDASRHYEDYQLARFISTVIAPGESTMLEFTGEDHEELGYLIFHTNPFDKAHDSWQIFELEYPEVILVQGVPIAEFEKKYFEERGVVCEKK